MTFQVSIYKDSKSTQLYHSDPKMKRRGETIDDITKVRIYPNRKYLPTLGRSGIKESGIHRVTQIDQEYMGGYLVPIRKCYITNRIRLVLM